MLVLAHLHRPVLTQQVHSLATSFQGKAIFRQALAKLSPNFRENYPIVFAKWNIHTKQ